MASAKKICRVCGKEYEACRTAARKDGIFRWQEVACSPECGAIYLKRVEDSRSMTSAHKERRRPVTVRRTIPAMEMQEHAETKVEIQPCLEVSEHEE